MVLWVVCVGWEKGSSVVMQICRLCDENNLTHKDLAQRQPIIREAMAYFLKWFYR